MLAANAHNSQPWRFDLSDCAIDVHADLDRHLGAFDPFRREMHQSLACAIENLVQAASAQGLGAEIEVFPGALPPRPDDSLAARVRLFPARVSETELFRAIPARHTNRGAYDAGRSLPAAVLRDVAALADQPRLHLIPFDGGARRAELCELIRQATHLVVADRKMSADNAKWFRFRGNDVANRRDGLTLGANVASPLVAAADRVLTPPDALANKSWIGATTVQLKTAPFLGVIAVSDVYERSLAIEVGRLWQRLQLYFTAHGIAAQPLNQPVERTARERELGLRPQAGDAFGRLVGGAALQSAFVLRAGYAKWEACLSPRRPLHEVVVGAGSAAASTL